MPSARTLNSGALAFFAAAVPLFIAAPVGAKVITVGDSVAEAMSSATTGDTLLLVGPRVWHEHIVLDKPVRLLGTNSPVIDAEGSGTAITVRAHAAQVIGLIIRNAGTDLGAFDSGVMLQAPEVIVSNCRVEGGGFGIYIRGADDCRVQGNTIIGNTVLPPAKRGNGIHLWKTKHNQILGNCVSGTRDGLYFSYADKNTIQGNDVRETRFGIHYMYSHENELIGNTLSRNAVGAALMFARNCRVEGNKAVANRRHGILLKQVDNSVFRHNLVYGQNRGFFIQQASKNRFEANAVASNDIGLYLSNGSEQNVFTGNAFIRNTDQVWQPQDEMELGRQASNAFYAARHGNFWSDYTGRDANNDGIGDTPYHETDLYGYMVDHHPEARVFALSPAVALLRKGEELLPILNTTGITDLYPLARLPRDMEEMLNQGTRLVAALSR